MTAARADLHVLPSSALVSSRRKASTCLACSLLALGFCAHADDDETMNDTSGNCLMQGVAILSLAGMSKELVGAATSQDSVVGTFGSIEHAGGSSGLANESKRGVNVAFPAELQKAVDVRMSPRVEFTVDAPKMRVNSSDKAGAPSSVKLVRQLLVLMETMISANVSSLGLKEQTISNRMMRRTMVPIVIIPSLLVVLAGFVLKGYNNKALTSRDGVPIRETGDGFPQPVPPRAFSKSSCTSSASVFNPPPIGMSRGVSVGSVAVSHVSRQDAQMTEANRRAHPHLPSDQSGQEASTPMTLCEELIVPEDSECHLRVPCLDYGDGSMSIVVSSLADAPMFRVGLSARMASATGVKSRCLTLASALGRGLHGMARDDEANQSVLLYTSSDSFYGDLKVSEAGYHGITIMFTSVRGQRINFCIERNQNCINATSDDGRFVARISQQTSSNVNGPERLVAISSGADVSVILMCLFGIDCLRSRLMLG